MKITVLIDNNAPEYLLCEWGLSFFIEYRGGCYLLDTGSSGLFAENAEKLGIDLSRVNAAVLSHAHYDHSDGMDVFFEKNQKAKLYIRKGAGENCYGTNEEGVLRYIGIKEGFLEQFAGRIIYADGDTQIGDGVYLIPHRSSDLEEAGTRAGMKIRTGDRWETDTFRHEQSLVFRTEQGLVVFNSCSHAGPEKIIREIMETFPGEHICAYLGGLHLYRSDAFSVRSLAGLMKEQEVDRIYTGHCTGEEAFRILQEELGEERVVQFYSGFSVSIQ